MGWSGQKFEGYLLPTPVTTIPHRRSTHGVGTEDDSEAVAREACMGYGCVPPLASEPTLAKAIMVGLASLFWGACGVFVGAGTGRRDLRS